MANLSIREAVKIYDVSRPTLTKALKEGKISGIKSDKGKWEIDHSELARIYQTRATNVDKDGKEVPVRFSTVNTSYSADIQHLKSALALAESRADAAEKLAQERADRIDDLRRMLPAPTQPRKRGWWPWL
ncbi:MAG: hypothetical protein Q4P24_15825 [Rhodobacterales bacterium]|nr:hypothetical protein [Rhodobacterales bacterium]